MKKLLSMIALVAFLGVLSTPAFSIDKTNNTIVNVLDEEPKKESKSNKKSKVEKVKKASACSDKEEKKDCSTENKCGDKDKK